MATSAILFACKLRMRRHEPARTFSTRTFALDSANSRHGSGLASLVGKTWRSSLNSNAISMRCARWSNRRASRHGKSSSSSSTCRTTCASSALPPTDRQPRASRAYCPARRSGTARAFRTASRWPPTAGGWRALTPCRGPSLVQWRSVQRASIQRTFTRPRTLGCGQRPPREPGERRPRHSRRRRRAVRRAVARGLSLCRRRERGRRNVSAVRSISSPARRLWPYARVHRHT
mmetsp:Transcript_15453/g.38936  ORF Transcript_15453/g.38936 Transcript_15453/m.38936 type:complete len:232 (+) Transcript_15453:1373-2068(+)